MMKGRFGKIITIGLVVIMAIAMLLMVPAIGGKAAGVVGVAGDKLTDIARTVFGIALGLFLIQTGVAALTVPVVGVILIGLGVGLVAYSVWPLFRRKTTITKE